MSFRLLALPVTIVGDICTFGTFGMTRSIMDCEEAEAAARVIEAMKEKQPK